MKNIEELLERNNLTVDYYLEESYSSLLVSIFETIADEMNDPEEKNKIKGRLMRSQNKKLTIKNIVKQYTSCIVNDNETLLILSWIEAYFAKRSERKRYELSVKQKLIIEQKNQCKICGKTISTSDAELDHIIPWSYVGDELGTDNLQMLCKECNRHKSKSSSYNLKMFLIKR